MQELLTQGPETVADFRRWARVAPQRVALIHPCPEGDS